MRMEPDSRRSRKIFSDQCKWFMALMFYLCVYLICVCVCQSFILIILSLNRFSCPSIYLTVPLYPSMLSPSCFHPSVDLFIMQIFRHRLFVVFPFSALRFSSWFPLPALHANIKLQNYHLCNSCGNTNKSQFYGAAFFLFFPLAFFLCIYIYLFIPLLYFFFAKNCYHKWGASRVSLGSVIFLSVAVITISAGRFHSLCFFIR